MIGWVLGGMMANKFSTFRVKTTTSNNLSRMLMYVVVMGRPMVMGLVRPKSFNGVSRKHVYYGVEPT